jgi:hypothetical protein
MRMRILWTIFGAAAASFAAEPALTVYNQNFAIVRETVPLDLKAGVTPVEFAGVTSQLEPESVLLRDPASGQHVLVLEQSYHADPVSIESLLTLNEGNTIEFLVRTGDKIETVRGRIVRAGAAPRNTPFYNYGYNYAPQQQPPRPITFMPVIEIDGKLRFELPGTPVFPSIGEGTRLKPALHWLLQSDRARTLSAELSYSSRGFNWAADYNIVQNAGNRLDVTAWVTVENESGKTFENAHIKLMAGDVRKLQQNMHREEPSLLRGSGA